MPEDSRQPTLLDWSQVKTAVSAVRTSLGFEQESRAFPYFAISKILKIDDDEINSSITDGGDDRGVDALFIDSRSDRRTIHLFQFKWVTKFEKTGSYFPSNEIDKLISFLDACLRKDETLKDSCNALLWEKVESVWAALDEAVHSIQVHLCNNAAPLTDAHRLRFEEALRPYQHGSLRQHDLMWFSRALTKSANDDRELTLRLVEDQYYGRTDGFAKGLIGTVRADELVSLISDREFPQEIDESLFEDNIRIYLGEENDINRKILSSALSQENAQFWYLNNGITITCEKMDYQPKASAPRVRMLNPQIVNGGQTSHALFEAARSDPARVADIRLLVRIIETADERFTNSVAEATNSQTPIRSRDIRSNDSIQIRLENALAGEGYFYERKNDQHIDQPSEKRIDAVKLGQVILAYVLREPDRAKTASNRIFGEYYHWVFDESILSSENVIAVWKLYRLVDDDRRKTLAMMSSRIRGSYDESWIVEGVFHLLFMLSLTAESEGTDLFDYQAVQNHYDDVKQQIDEFMMQNPGQAAYRVFRSSMTKRLLAKFAKSKQLDLPLPEVD